MAVVSGMLIGEWAIWFKPYTLVILATVLSFSTSGMVFSEIQSMKAFSKDVIWGIVLNYIIFSSILIPLAYWLSPSKDIFYGFVVIAATPPGVAIIPFSLMLNGNLARAVIGTFGAFVASIFFAPIIIQSFTGNAGLSYSQLFYDMLNVIVVPMMVSRLLLLKPIKPFTIQHRGRIVNWGFAIIIFTAVGLNRAVFLSNFELILRIGLILGVAIFGLGQASEFLFRHFKMDYSKRISNNLLLTMKSSGFSVAISMAHFGPAAVVPAAVMSILVLMYLLFLTGIRPFQYLK